MHAEHADGNRLNDLSRQVIGCAFTVLNTLGAGFLEKVYENALAQELRAAGLSVEQQCGVKVRYKDAVVGEYFADLMVENLILVELKMVKALDDAHRMQCTNYLKASGIRLGLLLNFAKPRLEIKRVAHGLQAALYHLRVLRASAFICVKILAFLPNVQIRNAG